MHEPTRTGIFPRPTWEVTQRWIVRVIVATAFFVAWRVAVTLDPPDKLPAVALGKENLYRLEIFLIVVYSALLTLTPFFYGVVRGKLPIEISARGAKWGEVSESFKETEDRINKLEQAVKRNSAQTLRARLEIRNLKQGTG